MVSFLKYILIFLKSCLDPSETILLLEALLIPSIKKMILVDGFNLTN